MRGAYAGGASRREAPSSLDESITVVQRVRDCTRRQNPGSWSTLAWGRGRLAAVAAAAAHGEGVVALQLVALRSRGRQEPSVWAISGLPL